MACPKQEMNPNILAVNIHFYHHGRLGIQNNQVSLSYDGIGMVNSTSPLPNISTNTAEIQFGMHILELIEALYLHL